MKAATETFERLKALPVSSAILDDSGTIVAVNDAWKDFGRRNGLRIPNSGIASNYLRYCGSGDPSSSQFFGDLKRLLAGQIDLLTFIYPCHSSREKRWFCMIGLPLSLDRAAGTALLHVNLTDMLPLPIGAAPARPNRKKRTHAKNRLARISGAIERSVSETLSSQLSAMLSSPGRSSERHKGSAQCGSERIVVHERLSKRQMQVLRLVGKGKTNKEIADLLFRSPNTIKLHVSAILQRLKLKSRTQAALLASRLPAEGAIDLAPGDITTQQNMSVPKPARAGFASGDLANVKKVGHVLPSRRADLG